MIQPGVYNITLQRRADFRVLLQFKDSNENPINLTGWTAVAQIWDQGRSEKYADFQTEYVNRALGQISLFLGYQETIDLPRFTEYDVLLINPSGLREYYVEGTITASEGYTVTT